MLAMAVRRLCLAAATAAAGWVLGAAGLPSSYLFGALLVGVAAALLAPDGLAVPQPAFTGALTVAGVVLGTLLDSSSLDAIADGWLPLALVTAATLAISLAAGAALARATSLDLPTAALGMVAGATEHATAAADPALGDAHGWLLTLGATAAGVALARATRFPGGSLLMPLAVGAVVSLAVPGGEFDVPPVVREVAFALIGLQVGLKFTLDTIRLLGRLLAPVLVALFGVLAACALLAVVLDAASAVSFRDAYLATTPGGVYAVLAIALGTDANAGFILAAQGLRLIVMASLAPVVIRWMVARAAAD